MSEHTTAPHERDELAELIRDNRTVWITNSEHAQMEAKQAEAILAAGYRKPRTVATVEELDALVVGSVVILRDSKRDPHPAQKGDHGWRLPFVDGFWTAEKLMAGCESAEVIS